MPPSSLFFNPLKVNSVASVPLEVI